MRKNRIVWMFSLLAVLSIQAMAAMPKLVVAILIDQMRYDYIERYQDHFATNGFRLFLDRGAFMTFGRYDYVPTVTGPGHASFLSGSAPSMHGIIANDWYDKQTKKDIYCVEDPSVVGVGTTSGNKSSPRNFNGSNFADQMRLHYRSKVVGVSMKDRAAILPAGKNPMGAFWFENKSGNFVTSSYYMDELPDWVKRFNDRKRAAQFIGQTWDRLIDSKYYLYADAGLGEGKLTGETNSIFPHRVNAPKEGYGSIMPTPFGNQILEEFAEAAVKGENLGDSPQPDLLCVSFSSIDYVGHNFGPYSHEVQDAVLRLDLQLQQFFNFLDKRIGLANVMMVLTADHGVAPNAEFAADQGMSSQQVNEGAFMTNIVTQLEKEYGTGKYFVANKLYGGNVFLDHSTLRQKGLNLESVSSFIREKALASGKVQVCYTREQLLDGRAPGYIGSLVLKGYNAERGGDLVMVLKPFAVPGGKTGTTHGSPYSYDTHVPILFYGASTIKPGRYPDPFYITDIAPTLCAALHIDEPAQSTGIPFGKILLNP